MTQGSQSVAIGNEAGFWQQGGFAVAVGRTAGTTSQGASAVAVGYSAGQTNQGGQSVAIGYLAGQTTQGATGILTNSSGSALNDTSVGHIRLKSSTGDLSFTTAAGWAMNANLAVTGDIILPDATLATAGSTLATVTQTAITSFALATYGAAKFIVTAKTGVNRQITELIVTHDGTTAIATEYGTVATSGTLATFDVDINVGSVRLLATSASASSTVYKVVETLIEA